MSEERILVDISPLLDKNVDFARNTLFANSSEKFMFKCGVKEVLDRLEALPTIDPETLRHLLSPHFFLRLPRFYAIV